MSELALVLCQSVDEWLKLRLPDEFIKQIPQNYEKLLNLIFDSLSSKVKFSSNLEDEVKEAATGCII